MSSRGATQSRLRGDIHDAPRLIALLQAFNQLPRTQKGPSEVDLHGVVPGFLGHVHQLAGRTIGGVVDQDINTAELLIDLLVHGQHIFFLAYIRKGRQRLHPIGLLDLLNHLIGDLRLTSIVDHDLGPFCSKEQADGLAQAMRSTCYQYDFVLKIEVHSVYSQFICVGYAGVRTTRRALPLTISSKASNTPSSLSTWLARRSTGICCSAIMSTDRATWAGVLSLAPMTRISP